MLNLPHILRDSMIWWMNFEFGCSFFGLYYSLLPFIAACLHACILLVVGQIYSVCMCKFRSSEVAECPPYYHSHHPSHRMVSILHRNHSVKSNFNQSLKTLTRFEKNYFEHQCSERTRMASCVRAVYSSIAYMLNHFRFSLLLFFQFSETSLRD